MRIQFIRNSGGAGGSVIVYFILVMAAALGLGSATSYIATTSRLAARRSDLVKANQYAIGGAVIACNELNLAMTNTTGTIVSNLIAEAYSLNSTLSTSTQKVYQRTISTPFSNQVVAAQIWLTNSSSPSSAKIISWALVGRVTWTNTVNVKMAWGYPAAIISVNYGTTSTSVSKDVAQDGNVVINGDKTGPIVVDGGPGLAVLANGRLNMDTNYVNPPKSSYSMTNYSTVNQIPDYTTQGTKNTLFDLGRFIAISDATPNGPSPSHNNHFTNVNSFIKAMLSYPGHSPQRMMQGVVTVDVWPNDRNMDDLTDKSLPNGINVSGTLIFNFLGSGWDPSKSKIIITADININPADLSTLVPTDPKTYKSGYPAFYTDSSKDPVNINIAPSYENFSANDDLPALLYSIGVADLHGNLNISGVCYTPSFMEIENKVGGNTQYLKGALIMGYGIYYENTSRGAKSVISFDPSTIDSLATLKGAGKQVRIAYWE